MEIDTSTDPLNFIARGWRIFPCHTIIDGRCSCGDADCKNPGKHPRIRAWQTNASNDPDQIAEWSRKFRNRINWAIATGPGSGVSVLDLDRSRTEDGYESMEIYEERHGPLARSNVTVLTGSGGQHLYYLSRPGEPKTTAKLWPGVDVRSGGGYVIAPGAIHRSGRIYAWESPGDREEMAEFPDLDTSWRSSAATVLKAMREHGIQPIRKDRDYDPEGRMSWVMRCPDPDGRHSHGDRDPSFVVTYDPERRRTLIHCRVHADSDAKADLLQAVGLAVGDLNDSDYQHSDAAEDFAEEPGREVPTGPAKTFEELVERRITWLKADETAREMLAAERTEALDIPEIIGLDDLLRREVTEPEYRIDRIMTSGAKLLLVAPTKAGKSTLVGNLARSLVDGDPFLDAFTVVSPVDRLLIIDNEMDLWMMRRWTADQDIQNTDRVSLLSLRGRESTFDMMSAAGRAEWARRIAAAKPDYVILDCLRPFLDALGLDENHDGSKFIRAFNEMLTMAGVKDTLIVHHSGHSGEHARGDSAIMGTTDAWWFIRRDKDDPSQRLFRSEGRDISVPLTPLVFDDTTRHLSLDQSRSRISTALASIQAQLTSGQKNKTEIESALTPSLARADIRAALEFGVREGVLLVRTGARGAKFYSLRPDGGAADEFDDDYEDVI